MLEKTNYVPDDFLDAYVKFPDLASLKTEMGLTKNKKVRIYTFAGYYIWGVYLLSGLMVFQFSPWIGLGALLISPLIVAGGLYVVAYIFWYLKNTPQKLAKLKKTKKRD